MSDLALKELQARWHQLDKEFLAAGDRAREQTITSEMYKLEGAIAAEPADTLPGCAVKSDVLAWQYDHGAHVFDNQKHYDSRVVASLLRDILCLTGELRDVPAAETEVPDAGAV